jgi:anti-repressor protein
MSNSFSFSHSIRPSAYPQSTNITGAAFQKGGRVNDLAVFNYQDREIRVVKDGYGEPWWVAKDVAEVLGIEKYRDALSRLDEDERGSVKVDTLGGLQEMGAVNESGLYNLIIRSNKEEAKPFRKWITSEVLPSIRKHGAYMTPETIEKVLSDPDTIIRLATDLKAEREKRRALEAERAALLPKADFFDAVASSRDAIDMGRVAKVIGGIGRNTLFAILRDKKILMQNNIPYQAYCDRGYFRVVEQKYNKPDGSVHVTTKTLVYQRGLQFILKVIGRTVEAA